MTRYLVCIPVTGGCRVISRHWTLQVASRRAAEVGGFVGITDGQRIVKLRKAA
jgi:hypothetical protein